MSEKPPGKCEIEGCKRQSAVVVNRQGQWKAVCVYHNAPKHWKLKDDFEVNTTLFGSKQEG